MSGADISQKLLNRAGKLLAHRAYSRGELRNKLSRYAEEQLVAGVLDRLEELKLINDTEYAYVFALKRITQDGWGPLKVRQTLQHQQVAPDLVERAIAMAFQKGDERLILRVYLERHCRKSGLPEDLKSIRKLISHLRRRGFHEEIIVSTLRDLYPPKAWGHPGAEE